MKKYWDFLIKGFYAGIFIGIGGIVYLAVENKIVGSFLFSFGLLTVCMYSFNLYTGKVGYLVDQKITYVLELLFSLLGNFLGTYVVGSLIRFTRFQNYVEVAQSLVQIKLNDQLLSIFLLAFFCGIIMFVVVNNYKKQKDVIGKYLPIFMGIMVFILCGFEHCVANMFYFSVAGIFSWKMALYLFVMVLGNSLGSIFIAFYDKKYLK